MSTHPLPRHEFTQTLPERADDVFAWHLRPGALARLLPPWQPVGIAQESDSLRDGSTVLRFPAGRRWVARHLPEQFEEGRRFADRLESRPFVVPLSWEHHHRIDPAGDGSVLLDRVETRVPRRLLRPMFDYRHRQLRDDLEAHRALTGSTRLTVAITGASGLVGSALTAFLSTGGHRVIRLVRGQPHGVDQRRWEPEAPDPALLSGVDAVVHLAGHSIAGRFTASHRESIRGSRVEPTRLLARAAAAAGVPVFVSASAIGYYGTDRGEEELTEESGPGAGFLAEVVADWERAAVEGAGGRMRLVLVRTGIVQSPSGGALKWQRPLFAAGLGGRLGTGEQWQSWIGIDDLLDIYLRAVVDERIAGPLNAVSPAPVRQLDYATALGRALHRPTLLPTPAVGPRLLLGTEGAQEIVLASQRVLPARLQQVGHRFRFTRLEPALRHQLGGLAP